MSAPGDERDVALRRAAGHFLRRRGPAVAPAGEGPPWDAGFFGIEDVARFRDADDRRRHAVLSECAAHLLAESWFIERCGVVFCAKMTSLAESLEEQRLFALIGADEAAHSTWLEPWIADPGRAADPFNRFVAGLVEEGRAQPLAFLLQVVLEGFGIVHYGDLASACRDTALATTLKRMAQDEALHHAAGLATFRASRLDERERRFLAEGAYTFLQMIRSGPQAVAGAIDHAIGVGDQADAARLFAELDAEAASAAKLGRFRRLMLQPGMEWLISDLEQKGLFDPCTAAECARIYTETR